VALRSVSVGKEALAAVLLFLGQSYPLLWSLLGPGGDAEHLIRTGTGLRFQPAVWC